LAAWAHRCLDEIEAVVDREGIDCEFARCPYYTPTNTEAAGRALPLLVKYYSDLGLPASLIHADDFDLVTYPTHGAMMLDDQGRCNPYKLVRGLREAVLRMGVRLYEGTNVTSVAGGSEAKITTSSATLTAAHAVLALNGHAAEFGFLKDFLRPAHTYCMITEPMDETTAKSVGPTHSEDLLIFDYGPNEPHYYQRFRSDHRLIFGGGSTPPADPAKRMASEDDQTVFRDIHTQMIRRYPKLANVAIEAAWGGPMALTKNSTPLITALPDHENVTLAIIGNGNGVGLGCNAGALVMGTVMGKDSLDAPARAFLEYCGG
jgi:glycine/D-amino acid oxidase-like deaminating enzyme